MISHLRMIHFSIIIVGSVVLYFYFAPGRSIETALIQLREIISIVDQVEEYEFPREYLEPTTDDVERIVEWINQFNDGESNFQTITDELENTGFIIDPLVHADLSVEIKEFLVDNMSDLAGIAHESFSQNIDGRVFEDEFIPVRIFSSSSTLPSQSMGLNEFISIWDDVVNSYYIPEYVYSLEFELSRSGKVYSHVEDYEEEMERLGFDKRSQSNWEILTQNIDDLVICEDGKESDSIEEEIKVVINRTYVVSFCVELESTFRDDETTYLKLLTEIDYETIDSFVELFGQTWNRHDWHYGEFDVEFSELSSAVGSLLIEGDQTLTELEGLLDFANNQTSGELTMFGLNVNTNLIAFGGPILLLCMYVYLYLHFDAYLSFLRMKLLNKEKVKIGTPWIAFYIRSLPSAFVSYATLVFFVPIVVSVPLASDLVQSDLSGTVGEFAINALFILIAILIAYRIALLLVNLAKLDYEFDFSEKK